MYDEELAKEVSPAYQNTVKPRKMHLMSQFDLYKTV